MKKRLFIMFSLLCSLLIGCGDSTATSKTGSASVDTETEKTVAEVETPEIEKEETTEATEEISEEPEITTFGKDYNYDFGYEYDPEKDPTLSRDLSKVEPAGEYPIPLGKSHEPDYEAAKLVDYHDYLGVDENGQKYFDLNGYAGALGYVYTEHEYLRKSNVLNDLWLTATGLEITTHGTRVVFTCYLDIIFFDVEVDSTHVASIDNTMATYDGTEEYDVLIADRRGHGVDSTYYDAQLENVAGMLKWFATTDETDPMEMLRKMPCASEDIGCAILQNRSGIHWYDDGSLDPNNTYPDLTEFYEIRNHELVYIHDSADDDDEEIGDPEWDDWE